MSGLRYYSPAREVLLVPLRMFTRLMVLRWKTTPVNPAVLGQGKFGLSPCVRVVGPLKISSEPWSPALAA